MEVPHRRTRHLYHLEWVGKCRNRRPCEGIAAALATDASVVVATGDGGFLMNAAEIEMATRLGLGHTLVVFNDNDYGLPSGNQLAHAGGHVGTESTNPDVERFVVSFGIDGYRPETRAEVETTLETVVPSTELSSVEITPGESRVMHLSWLRDCCSGGTS